MLIQKLDLDTNPNFFSRSNRNRTHQNEAFCWTIYWDYSNNSSNLIQKKSSISISMCFFLCHLAVGVFRFSFGAKIIHLFKLKLGILAIRLFSSMFFFLCVFSFIFIFKMIPFTSEKSVQWIHFDHFLYE